MENKVDYRKKYLFFDFFWAMGKKFGGGYVQWEKRSEREKR
jgi:hypothetical protein